MNKNTKFFLLILIFLSLKSLEAHSVIESNDNGYLIAGSNQWDMCLVKLESDITGLYEHTDELKGKFPKLQYGYFNRTREDFYPEGYEADWPKD